MLFHAGSELTMACVVDWMDCMRVRVQPGAGGCLGSKLSNRTLVMLRSRARADCMQLQLE